MRKILLGAFAAIMALSFTSCDDDDTKLYYSYGTVQEKVSGENLQIRKDAGGYLTVKGATGGLKAGDRVIVTYEVVGKLEEGGDNTIKLRRIYDVLTKDARLKSVLDEDEQEDAKLGDDGLLRATAWYGGEYLNIDFTMLFGRNQTQPHFFNLVADDVDFEGNTMTVRLRHNAYDAIPGGNYRLYAVDGMVSFNLVNLFDELEIAEADYPTRVNVEWEKYESQGSATTTTQTIVLGQFKPWTVVTKEPKKADLVRGDMDTVK